MTLSVIIPALNEARTLPRLLTQLQAQEISGLQIIVADGGSSDDTPALARANGATVVSSDRGRGLQMNTGAREAQSDWLLFLHADSELPSHQLLADALALMRAAMPPSNGKIAGHFPLKFLRVDSGQHDFFFRYVEGKSRVNRPYTINGDQGLLIPATYFHALGGFDESLPFLEDQRIAAKIFSTGRWLILPGHLITSARRFETEGHTQRYTLMALMMGLNAAGASEFFTRAPAIYTLHTQGQALDLQPYLNLARQVLRERGRWKTLYRIAGFGSENIWQLFYYLDLKRGDSTHSCLRFYDRHLASIHKNSVGQTLIALLLSIWFFFYLPWRLKKSAGTDGGAHKP